MYMNQGKARSDESVLLDKFFDTLKSNYYKIKSTEGGSVYVVQ